MVRVRRVNWVRILFLILLSGFIVVPLSAAVFGGFKSAGELQANPFGLPQVWEFQHFVEVASNPFLWRSMKNSFVISILTLVVTLIVAGMTAFSFSHIKFFGQKYIYSYFILGMMFPFATGIIPLFIKVRDLGLLDSVWGVVIPQVAFGLAMAILLFRSFFEQLPSELFDAARVDGCGYARFFFSVVLPLSTPILATVGVFVLVASWNNYLLPLVVLNSDSLYPWTLGVMQYQGLYATEWNKVLVYVLITMLPAFGFFIAGQKYIVAGLTGGAVKG